MADPSADGSSDPNLATVVPVSETGSVIGKGRVVELFGRPSLTIVARSIRFSSSTSSVRGLRAMLAKTSAAVALARCVPKSSEIGEAGGHRDTLQIAA